MYNLDQRGIVTRLHAADCLLVFTLTGVVAFFRHSRDVKQQREAADKKHIPAASPAGSGNEVDTQFLAG